jgi:hypothetical protein
MTRKQWGWVAGSVGLLVLIGIPVWLSFWSGVNEAKLNVAFTGLQAVGSLLVVAALIAAFAQVREAKKQLRQNRDWNKMSFALSYLPQFEMLRGWEKQLDESFLRIIRRELPLTADEVQELYKPANDEIFLLLKTFMNALEAYCVAINMGLADEDVARRFWGFKLTRHFEELEPYINHERKRNRTNAIFCELEDVYKRWSPKIVLKGRKFGEDGN